VNDGQRHRESLKHIYREVSQAPPPIDTGGMTTAKLNEMVDQRLSEMFADEVENLKRKAKMVDQKLSELTANEIERTKRAEEKNQDLVKENKTLIKELKELKDELNALKGEWNETKDSVENLEAQVDKNLKNVNDRESEEVEQEDDDDEEPTIALEDQLRITEQSAKAIGLLSDHLLSTVWQTCSKNTFGNKPQEECHFVIITE
jgi:chromosome segregation ATPase